MTLESFCHGPILTAIFTDCRAKMAVVDVGMLGQLLLALDPRTSPVGRTDAPLFGTQSPPGSRQGLHRWDLARLCPPPDPPAPLPRTNQSARAGVGNRLRFHASAKGAMTDPSNGQSRDSIPGQPRPVELARVIRSATGTTNISAGSNAVTPLPIGCMQLAVPNGDDDDHQSADTTLNWTQGAVHCSRAGLTAIPPLPINAQYL